MVTGTVCSVKSPFQEMNSTGQWPRDSRCWRNDHRGKTLWFYNFSTHLSNLRDLAYKGWLRSSQLQQFKERPHFKKKRNNWKRNSRGDYQCVPRSTASSCVVWVLCGVRTWPWQNLLREWISKNALKVKSWKNDIVRDPPVLLLYSRRRLYNCRR